MVIQTECMYILFLSFSTKFSLVFSEIFTRSKRQSDIVNSLQHPAINPPPKQFVAGG